MRKCRILFGMMLATLGTVFAVLPLQGSPSPTLTSIAIYPSSSGGFGTSNSILTLGTEVPFFATGFYSDSSTQDLTTSVAWASSVPAVATIGANTGLVIGASAGSTNITASLSGVTSAATPVTVAAGTLEGLAITPATAGVTAGSTMQLIAYGNYAIPGATDPWPTVLADLTHEVGWTSSNPSVASVSSSGVVTGIAVGTVTITVTMPGFTGTPETASVTIVPAPPNWTLTGNLFHQIAGQTATLLNDGTVLIAGGEDSSNAVLNLAQVYSPSTGIFTPTAGDMVVARTLPTATLLPDGTVLIAGGGSGPGGGGDIESAEIYNPSTGMFSLTANDMSAIRSGGATATLLDTGMVLVAGGGQAGTSADLYDPSTQTFTATGALNLARAEATATLLPGGEVLIAGGKDPSSGTGGALSSAELYDPTAGTFTLLSATMAFPREFHTATLLNNGEVLIAGGTSSTLSASTPPAYEELYDSTTQTFLPTGALNAPRIAHNALLLANGTVLIVGGGAPNDLTGLFGQSFPPQASCEVYNHATGVFTFTADMSYSRAQFTATMLQSGSVLAAGGEGIILFPAQAEIYPAPATSPTLVSIAVTPTSASIAAGDTQTFTAIGTYSNNTTLNITSTVDWASSNPAAATIASGGIATGVAAGSSLVTASLSAITSNSATLTVTAATLVSIEVTPTTASIAAGSTQAFTATGTYSNNSTENLTSTVTWISSNTAAATIVSGGVATGVAAGSSSITASLSGITSNSATLTVTAATLVSIAVTPTTASIAAGNTQDFSAIGTYSNSTTQNITSSVTWISSNTAAATIVPGGVATGVAVGSSSITASLSGVTSNSATLTVTAATLVSIAVTPTTASIAAGNTQAFSAIGTYSNSTTQNITSSVTWLSSNTAAATIVPGGVATGVAVGGSSITASRSGIMSNSATLSVTAATLVSIAVTPITASIAAGNIQAFTAIGTFSNKTTQNITSSVTWLSSNTAAATIVAGGVATGVAVGSSSITASLLGVTSNSATLTVTAATEASMSVSPTLLSFGNQALDTTSTAKQVTLTSTGTSNLNISSITMTGTNAGNFAQTNNCPASLAPAAKCIINVTYTPSVRGGETANLTVTGIASNSPQTIALSGTGIVQASVSPTSWSFGSQPMVGKCDTKSVTLTNNLPTVLTITRITFTGADPGDFSQTNACGKSLAAKSQCTISVSFMPRAKGSRSATMNVNDSANNSPQTVTLTGTGE